MFMYILLFMVKYEKINKITILKNSQKSTINQKILKYATFNSKFINFIISKINVYTNKLCF